VLWHCRLQEPVTFRPRSLFSIPSLVLWHCRLQEPVTFRPRSLFSIPSLVLWQCRLQEPVTFRPHSLFSIPSIVLWHNFKFCLHRRKCHCFNTVAGTQLQTRNVGAKGQGSPLSLGKRNCSPTTSFVKLCLLFSYCILSFVYLGPSATISFSQHQRAALTFRPRIAGL